MKAALATLMLLLPGSTNPVEVDFSILSGFEYTEGMKLPAKVRNLDGKTIKTTGFIRTEDGSTEDIQEFWLVDQGCDCQGNPNMNDMIYCVMPEGQVISNDDSLIEVTGVFSAGEEKEDGYVLTLYRLQVGSVQ